MTRYLTSNLLDLSPMTNKFASSDFDHVDGKLCLLRWQNTSGMRINSVRLRRVLNQPDALFGRKSRLFARRV